MLKYKLIPGMRNWTRGDVDGFRFHIKHYPVGSMFGIDGGKISKLEIRRNNVILINYNRGLVVRYADCSTMGALAPPMRPGWDMPVTDETRGAYDAILRDKKHLTVLKSNGQRRPFQGLN
jgi:hypothetical protein